MLCPSCGSEVAADAEVCARCGCVLSFALPDGDGVLDEQGEGAPAQREVDFLAEAGQGGAWAEAPGTAARGPVPTASTSRRLGDSSLRVAGIVLGTALAVVSLGTYTLSSGMGSARAAEAAVTRMPASAEPDANPGAPTTAAIIQAVDAPEGWDERYVDGRGNPSVYALTELSGERLEGLLRALGFTWVEDARAWSTERTALYAYDGTGYLDAEEMASLDTGAGGGALYQIATSDYERADDAYAGLVSQVMESEDSEFVGGAGFGVAYGPSMVDYLVEVTEGEDHVSLFVFGPGPMRAGLFDELARGSYGSTAREAFESVTGRAPGSRG